MDGEMTHGTLERVDVYGNTYVGSWKVWEEVDDRFIEVCHERRRERAMLTLREDSSRAYKQEACRIFQRMIDRMQDVTFEDSRTIV